MLAGVRQIGQPTLMHSGCGWGPTLPDCMASGLTRRPGFDCSGFVANAICEVWGKPVDEWPAQLRHTRQLAQFMTSLSVAHQGDLYLHGYDYSPDIVVPSHVSVVANEDPKEFSFVHAKTTAGWVEFHDGHGIDSSDSQNRIVGSIGSYELARVAFIDPSAIKSDLDNPNVDCWSDDQL